MDATIIYAGSLYKLRSSGEPEDCLTALLYHRGLNKSIIGTSTVTLINSGYGGCPLNSRAASCGAVGTMCRPVPHSKPILRVSLGMISICQW